jgi:hypothetical protein
MLLCISEMGLISPGPTAAEFAGAAADWQGNWIGLFGAPLGLVGIPQFHCYRSQNLRKPPPHVIDYITRL